ncbi:hypothetical protein BGW80DRAFT_1225355 [Lactifluus volemus]|nr:hypothetical protein BGW80DRAFT_1225355 [Lactifluus volemus]
MSFPPRTANGSAAAEFALYMHPSTFWDTEWYAFHQIPPHLVKEPLDIRFECEVVSERGIETLSGVILFPDLSMCWYSVIYGIGIGCIKRSARFRRCPKPMSGAALRRAAETHGAAVANFADDAAASGQVVDSGECWDVAHEGLKSAASLFGDDDAPVPSTSRAHGHLIFCGKPRMGRWRGGDDRLRRGDIVEWRSARIGKAQGGAFATLGNPDHTAVLVQDTVPRGVVADGKSIDPANVGVLTVVEQSPGQTPKQNSYDLAKLRAGEVWVYRPVSMVEYLGSTLSIDIPTGLDVCSDYE